MTKKEAFRILRITHDIKYTYKSGDGKVNFMNIIDTYKAQAEADMAVGSYSITQNEIDEAYNFLQSEYNAKVTGTRTTGSGNSRIVSILTGAGAIVLTGAIIAGGIWMVKNVSKNKKPDNEKPSVVQQDEQDKTDYKDYVSYMGDLTDSKEVEQRANEILDMFAKNGIVHTETNSPYTVDEIKVILQYMNGGLLPDNISPEAANKAYLNMIADMFNTKIVLYNSAYMVGAQIIDFDKNGNILDFDGNVVNMNHIGYDQSTGLTIIDPNYAHLYSKNGLGTSEQHYARAVKNYVSLDVTDFQFGDSTAYPYLEWFSAKYNKLMTSTNKYEKVDIFNEITQSLADIVYGNGYQLKKSNGEIVLIQFNDFADYDDVNDYNALRILTSLYQGARVVVDQEDYELGNTSVLMHTQDVYKFVNNGAVAEVRYEDILDKFNAACADEDKDTHKYNSDGTLDDGDNLDQRAYSNTTDILAKNAENNDFDYWNELYSTSKRKGK